MLSEDGNSVTSVEDIRKHPSEWHNSIDGSLLQYTEASAGK